MWELLRKFMKNELNTCFQQKFATGSYGVGIGPAWCSQKACEICSSLVQKKKLKKIYFSSHKLSKQQSTSFWSQGILGVNTLIAFLLSHSMFSVFEVRDCLGKWQSKDLFLPCFQGSIDQ
jgi:hypothetical protein